MNEDSLELRLSAIATGTCVVSVEDVGGACGHLAIDRRVWDRLTDEVEPGTRIEIRIELVDVLPPKERGDAE